MENYLNTETPFLPMSKPTRDGGRRVIYKGYPLYPPEGEVLERFIAAYPDTPNKQLREITGRSTSYNSRLGNYLGLEKSEAFLEQRQKTAALRASMNHTKGKPKKGVVPEQLKPYLFGQPNGSQRQSGNIISARMREFWSKEKLRAKYGLLRQTKLRIKL